MSFKICVYAICKNEIEKISQWFNQVAKADYIVVLDTGSTDGTWEFLQNQQHIICAQQIIEPFRFDVARNEAQKLIPNDTIICVPMDIDQEICINFFDELKKQWRNDIVLLEFPQYFAPIHKSGFWFAHRYGAGCWKYPVYEQYIATGTRAQAYSPLIIHNFRTELEHHQKYLALAELGIKENPNSKYAQIVYKKICNELNI